MSTCNAPHPNVPNMTCELDEHDTTISHAATRTEQTTTLEPDPTAPLPKDADGNDITEDIDGNPIVPMIEVEHPATVTYSWAY